MWIVYKFANSWRTILFLLCENKDMGKKRQSNVAPTTKEIDDIQKEVDNGGLKLVWVKFIDEYLKCGVAYKAYHTIFPNCTEKSAIEASCRLLKKEVIQNEIKNKLTTQTITDEWISNFLVGLATEHAHGKGAIVSVKAVEILAKMKGLLVDTKKIAFTGENPAVFMPIGSVEQVDKLKNMANNDTANRVIE